MSQRPHRARTWALRGQTPVLTFNFNWKSLSAIAADYIDQMAKSAWPLEGRFVDAEVSASRHRVTVASGEPVTAVLSLVKIPKQPTIDASLRLIRVAALPR